jgi:DNA-binding transcriptional ArsR family regulator
METHIAAEEGHARFLRCIGEPTRLQLLKLLINDEKCVGELARALNKEQSLISFHLRALKGCNVVKDRQEAQKVYYKLTDDRLASLIINTEALTRELSLCKCQEVNYKGEGNQTSSEGEICPNS